MIVPMKKIAVIAQSKESGACIRSLQALGVLHVQHSGIPSGQDISELREDSALAENAIRILSSPEILCSSRDRKSGFIEDWKTSVRHVVESWKRLDQLEEYSRGIRNSIKEWHEWGDFDPADIKDLSSKGLFIKLYEIPVRELKNLPGNLIVRRLFSSSGSVGCAVISRGKIDLPFTEKQPPKMSVARMRERLAQDERAIDSIKKDMLRHACHLEAFVRIKRALDRELECHEAIRGMAQEGEISYVTGYAPFDAVSKIMNRAKEKEWAVFVTDPSETDDVPTLVKNPKWISIIEPIFKLIEIVPGYRELDISPLLLIFLGLFFGMIIGDAGYGALYILLTMLAQIKFGRKMKDKRIFYLLYFFSSCAIFWGVLTGTIFGQEWYIKSGFKPVIPVLNDTKFIQAFCFMLGAFHLTLAHGWQAIRKAPALIALADIGWIVVLWSAFFYARMLILSEALPGFVNPSLVCGISLVVFFTNPQKNILKAAGEGLGAVALSIMNNFTDVVSYVRLFAVGLAGVAISDTVNTLAADFAGNNIFIKIAIVASGHTINILLGPLSVLVHGVRLNVLEFSGHIGLTWSGTRYRPLKLLEK